MSHSDYFVFGEQPFVIEGHYIGSFHKIPIGHKKLGSLYVFLTKSGLKGVWGQRYLGTTMSGTSLKVGQLMRITSLGGENKGSALKRVRVEVDEDVCIDPALINADEVRSFISSASMVSGPPLFVLPNGGVIKFLDCHEKGGTAGAFRSRDTPDVRLRGTEKNKSFRLHLWSSGTRQHAIAADFDGLPPGYDSFDELYTYLFDVLMRTKKGVVIRTHSGKVKVVFVVELPSVDMALDHKLAREFLMVLLPDHLVQFIGTKDNFRKKDIVDASATALSILFLNPEIVQTLSLHLPNLIPYMGPPPGVLLVKGSGVSESITNTQEHPELPRFKEYEGVLTDYFVKLCSKSPAKERFIRILLSTPQLNTLNGFDLPITYLGKYLRVSPQAVHQWIKGFGRKKLLVVIDGKSAIGVKAITYGASNQLFQEIANLNPDYESVGKINLPMSISDGNWDRTLYLVAGYFAKGSYEEYMKWFNRLPGHDLKDRPKQAKHKFDSWVKYRKSKGLKVFE